MLRPLFAGGCCRSAGLDVGPGAELSISTRISCPFDYLDEQILIFSTAQQTKDGRAVNPAIPFVSALVDRYHNRNSYQIPVHARFASGHIEARKEKFG